MAPFIVPVELEKPMKQLVRLHGWVVFADTGDQDGPTNTTEVAHDVRMETASL